MASRNSYKHGGRSAEAIEERRRIVELMRAFSDSRKEVIA